MFIPNANLKTQKYMKDLEIWTKSKQMRLNEKKTNNIIFNFTKNSQFSTDIKLNGEIVETVTEAKLLGTIITNDLSWKIVRDGHMRMQFLHKSPKFTNNVKDLKQIYISQVRTKLEQSALVWHNGLTKRNENDIERIQKSALRVILKHNYTGYQNALVTLGMQSLRDRREELCLRFAKSCLKIEKFQKYFPMNSKLHTMPTRYCEKYALGKKLSERYARSALPSMIRLLNDHDKKKNEVTKLISNFVVPMNYGTCMSPSLC